MPNSSCISCRFKISQLSRLLHPFFFLTLLGSTVPSCTLLISVIYQGSSLSYSFWTHHFCSKQWAPWFYHLGLHDASYILSLLTMSGNYDLAKALSIFHSDPGTASYPYSSHYNLSCMNCPISFLKSQLLSSFLLPNCHWMLFQQRSYHLSLWLLSSLQYCQSRLSKLASPYFSCALATGWSSVSQTHPAILSFLVFFLI